MGSIAYLQRKASRGLHVAVNDALRVRRVEGAGDGIERAEHLEGAHAIAEAFELPEVIVERLAVEQLHHHEDRAVGVGAEREHADDALAPEHLQRLGLALEAHGELRIFGDVLAQELQRDARARLLVGRRVDHAMTAAADLPLQQVSPVDHFPRLRISCAHWRRRAS